MAKNCLFMADDIYSVVYVLSLHDRGSGEGTACRVLPCLAQDGIPDSIFFSFVLEKMTKYSLVYCANTLE